MLRGENREVDSILQQFSKKSTILGGGSETERSR